MKKLLLPFLLVFSTLTASAQLDMDKKFRGGIQFSPKVDVVMARTGKFTPKAGMGFDFGLVTDFALAKNFWLNTGLSVSFENHTQNFEVTDSVNYLYYDRTPHQFDENLAYDDLTTESRLFHLTARKSRAIYLSLPLAFKMKTNMIGHWQYFGKLGTFTSVLLNNRSNDEGFDYRLDSLAMGGTATTLEDMEISRELMFIKTALRIGGGAEWNISGNTSLLFELNVDWVYTDIYRESKSVQLLDPDTYKAMDLKGNEVFIGVTVGVLF